jgi:hypothetical protein
VTKFKIKRGCVVLLVTLTSACSKGGGPTTPTGTSLPSIVARSPSSTGTPLPSNGEAFEVTGVVTDDRGVPVAGAAVTMAHWLGGFAQRPSVRTDASGGYTIAFTSNPWMDGTSGRGAARAEVVAEGYDWYWRTVLATNPGLVENFRLQRIKRVTAGDSIVLSVTPDIGDCTGWLYPPCGRLRVTAPAGGNLTIEAVPNRVSAGLPQIEVCCVSGGEVYGNPVTLPVTAGTEVWVEVGQTRGSTASESVRLRTSLEPF